MTHLKGPIFIRPRGEPSRHGEAAKRASSASSMHQVQTAATIVARLAPMISTCAHNGWFKERRLAFCLILRLGKSHRLGGDCSGGLHAPSQWAWSKKTTNKPLEECPSPPEARGLHLASALVHTLL